MGALPLLASAAKWRRYALSHGMGLSLPPHPGYGAAAPAAAGLPGAVAPRRALPRQGADAPAAARLVGQAPRPALTRRWAAPTPPSDSSIPPATASVLAPGV